MKIWYLVGESCDYAIVLTDSLEERKFYYRCNETKISSHRKGTIYEKQ